MLLKKQGIKKQNKDVSLSGDKVYRLVSLDRVVPNPWNPNEMPEQLYRKLKAGLKRTLQETGDKIMPIVVRPHPTIPGSYEIIDGYHRWKAFGDLRQDKIGVWIIKASDKMARVLTNTLNYLRGQPHRAKYAKSVIEMLENGATFEELAGLLPETENELDQLLEESKISIEAFQALQSDADGDIDQESLGTSDTPFDDLTWTELKFKVTVSQARVIEQEIRRISEQLKGKNLRARALEYMAVQSSQVES